MLDVGWSEILVIALVLIIVVGPKDLPPMLRTFGRMANRLRGMANEFKGQFDQALREAELDDVRKGLGEVSKLNPTNTLRDAINPIRQLGQDIKSDLQKASDEAKSAYNAPPFMKTESELAAEAAANAAASGEAVAPAGTAEPVAAETKPAPVIAAAAMPTPSTAEVPAAKPKTARSRKTVSERAVASTPAAPKAKKAPAAAKDATVGEEAAARKPASRKKPAASETAPGLDTAEAAKPKKPAARKKTDTTGDA